MWLLLLFASTIVITSTQTLWLFCLPQLGMCVKACIWQFTTQLQTDSVVRREYSHLAHLCLCRVLKHLGLHPAIRRTSNDFAQICNSRLHSHFNLSPGGVRQTPCVLLRLSSSFRAVFPNSRVPTGLGCTPRDPQPHLPHSACIRSQDCGKLNKAT